MCIGLFVVRSLCVFAFVVSCLEFVWSVWKSAGLSGTMLGRLEIVWTVWKPSGSSGNRRDRLGSLDRRDRPDIVWIV